MTELDPTIPPLGEAFEAAYTLPEDFPESLRVLHTEILTRLRNESRAVPMNTVQTMLVERMAYFYVAMKYREMTADIPFALKEQKEMSDFWLKMTDVFLKGIAASESKSRTTLLVTIQGILRQSLKKVPDAELRRVLSQEWNAEFARIDI